MVIFWLFWEEVVKLMIRRLGNLRAIKFIIKTIVKHGVVSALVFSMGVGPFGLVHKAVANPGVSTTPLSPAQQEIKSDLYWMRRAAAEAEFPKVIQRLNEQVTLTESDYKLDLPLNDSLLDQNPFFLDGQKWVSAVQEGKSQFTLVQGKTEIILPSMGLKWQLPVALQPILETHDFILFSFSESFQPKDENSGGIFMVSQQELFAAARARQAAPIYFFPLPGNKWVSNSKTVVDAFEIPTANQIAFKDTDGVVLSINVLDIQTTVGIGNWNLFLATWQALENSYRSFKQSQSFTKVAAAFQHGILQLAKQDAESAPTIEQKFNLIENISKDISRSLQGESRLKLVPGSTAGYGTLYTGFDLIAGNRGQLFSLNQSDVSKNSLLDLVFPSANAVGDVSVQQIINDPALWSAMRQTAVVLGKCGAIYLAGTLLKYESIHKKAKAKLQAASSSSQGLTWAGRASVRAGENGNYSMSYGMGLLDQYLVSPISRSTQVDQYAFRVASEYTRASFDVLAHSFTAFSQFPTILTANIIETIFDYAKLSENSIVRKGFNATFGFSRSSSNKTPVNTKTLIFGVGILGGVDNALIVVQQFWAIPKLAGILGQMHPALEVRAERAWHGNPQDVALYNARSIVANVSGYAVSGAYGYAHDIQEINLTIAQRMVRDQMKHENINPDLPQNLQEFNSRVDKIVRERLRNAGLPGEEEFLFDANTIYANARKAIFGTPVSDGPNIASDRPGLAGRALNSAIQSLAGKTDPASLKALQLIRQQKSDLKNVVNFLKLFIQDPFAPVINPSGPLEIEALKFTGHVKNNIVKNFTMASEATVRARNILGLVMAGDLKNSAYIPLEWIQTYGEDVANTAASAIKDGYRSVLGYVPAVEAEPNLSGYIDPASVDPRKAATGFSKWQIERAISNANRRFVQIYGKSLGEFLEPEAVNGVVRNSDHIAVQNWKKVLQSTMMEVSGLYPDYQETEVIQAAQIAADEKLNLLLKSKPELVRYLGNGTSFDRAQIEAILLADFFSEAYVELTISQERIPARAAGQPGLFQPIRQTAFVRKFPAVAVPLRTVEALFSNSRYERGLTSQFYRVVPFAEDWWTAHVRIVRSFPMMATFGYAWKMLVWSSVMPWSHWFVDVLFAGTTIMAPWSTVNRLTMNLGLKPGDKVSAMSAFAFVGSWATFSGGLFYGLFKDDILGLMERLQLNVGKAWTCVEKICSCLTK